jgi:hypothetical protein
MTKFSLFHVAGACAVIAAFAIAASTIPSPLPRLSLEEIRAFRSVLLLLPFP